MKWIVAVVLMAELFACAWLAGLMVLCQTTIPERLQADLALGVAALQSDGNDVALLALKRIDGAHAALH